MKKKWLLGLMFLLSIPFALADIMGTLKNVFQKILSLGTLDFLGLSGIEPLTRLLIWLLCFTIFFATITTLGGKGAGKAPFSLFSRIQAGVIAAIIATIAAIFIPAQVLLAVGTGWATIIALFLIGGPVVGLAYLLWTIPGKDNQGNALEETKSTVLLKLVLCLLLFWVLSAMKNAAVLS